MLHLGGVLLRVPPSAIVIVACPPPSRLDSSPIRPLRAVILYYFSNSQGLMRCVGLEVASARRRNYWAWPYEDAVRAKEKFSSTPSVWRNAEHFDDFEEPPNHLGGVFFRCKK
jgi:hypothetical protein